MLQAISGGAAAGNLVKANASAINTNLGGLPGFINAIQPNGSNPAETTPQAFLTILFFDERFNFIDAVDGGVAQQRVASSVGPDGSSLAHNSIPAPKNGYAYVYISNQSNQDVFFDNLKVQVVTGNIIEENHYYSYGLKIAAISSKKLGNVNEGMLKNNYLYQGAYSEMDDDIGWNDFRLRNYDPQIGRWVQQDPYQQFASPYLGMGSDPINNTDPSGGIVPGGGLSTTAATAITLGEVVIKSVSHSTKAVSFTSQAISITGLSLNIANNVASIINTSITTEQAGNWVVLTNVMFETYLRDEGVTSTGRRFNQQKGYALELAYRNATGMDKNVIKTYNNCIPDGRQEAQYLQWPYRYNSYSRYTEIKATKALEFRGQISDEITGAAQEPVFGTPYRAGDVGIAEYTIVTFAENLAKGTALKDIYNTCVSHNVILNISVPLINTVTKEIKFTTPLQLNLPRSYGIYIPWERMGDWFKSQFSPKVKLEIERIKNSTAADTNEDGILFLFVNCFGQNSSNIMKKLMKGKGVFKEYRILPIDRKVQFGIIRDKSTFIEILKKYEGVKIEQKEADLINDTSFTTNFPLYDFSNKTNRFELANGLVAIDQSNTKKSNPYFICNSYDEYKLINQYLSIYFIDELKEPVIECVLFSHLLIKKFLKERYLKLIDGSVDGCKVFRSGSGEYIYLQYSSNNSSNISGALFSEFIDQKDAEIYHSLVIYESLSIMKLLGKCDIELHYEEKRFDNYTKELFIRPGISLPVKIINAAKLPNLSIVKKEKIGDGSKEGFSDVFLIDEGKIISQYSQDIYLQFESKSDFDFFSNMIPDLKSSFNERNRISDFHTEIENVARKLDGDELRDELLDLNTQEQSLKQVLVLLEEKMNRYFFDKYFVNQYFPKLAAYIGFVIINKEGGFWSYDKKSGRPFVQTKSGAVLDFIPDLYEEMLKQKYTGFCHIEAIIEGLLTGARLKVISQK